MTQRSSTAHDLTSSGNGPFSEREPTLRLRFDPPPEAPPVELGGVLSEVEHLSHGIDSMLHKASKSAIGAAMGQSDSASEDDDPDFEGDDPMIAMFDEDEPSDIHSIDRMLADEAQQLLPNTMGLQAEEKADAIKELEIAAAKLVHGNADDVSTPDPEPTPESEVSLEGDFESFESLIGSLPSLSLPAPIVAKAALAVSDPLPSAAISETPVALQATNPVKAATPALVQTSLATLEHAQAAGLVDCVAAAETLPVTSAAPPAKPAQAVEPLPTAAAMKLDEPPQFHDVAPSNTSPAQQSHSSQASDHFASTTESMPVDGIAGRRNNPLAGFAQMLALTNLPLRILPPSMKPMVNALALSLLVWAPAIWTLAPHLAARQAAAAMELVEAPAHGESTLKTEDAEGAAEHGSGHGGAEAEGKKKSAAAKKSGGKSAVKSKAKKSDAGHASAGGH